MKDLPRVLGIVLVVVGIGAIISKTSRPAELVYQGRSLSWWLEAATLEPSDEQGDSPSDKGIRQFGTNAIPTYLRMLRAKDSPLAIKFRALVKMQHLFKNDFKGASALNLRAQYGFRLLGNLASNAVPALIEIHEQNISRSSRKATVAAIAAIGPPAIQAIPLLIRESTNSNAEVRVNAIWALGCIHARAEVALPVLIKSLRDAARDVRTSTINSLAKFGSEAKPALPAIVEALKDPEATVRQRAASALGAIHMESESVVPALTAALDDTDYLVRLSASDSLGFFGKTAGRAVSKLVEMTNDSDGIVRDSARLALKKIEEQSTIEGGTR